jgi:hypothetical protein
MCFLCFAAFTDCISKVVSSMKYELNPSLFTSLHGIYLPCSFILPFTAGACCRKQLHYRLSEHLRVFSNNPYATVFCSPPAAEGIPGLQFHSFRNVTSCISVEIYRQHFYNVSRKNLEFTLSCSENPINGRT